MKSSMEATKLKLIQSEARQIVAEKEHRADL